MISINASKRNPAGRRSPMLSAARWPLLILTGSMTSPVDSQYPGTEPSDQARHTAREQLVGIASRLFNGETTVCSISRPIRIASLRQRCRSFSSPASTGASFFYRLPSNAGKHSSDEPTRLAHLDYYDERAIRAKSSVAATSSAFIIAHSFPGTI
jgi:hypothetical protein